jgi:hypothetical protein
LLRGELLLPSEPAVAVFRIRVDGTVRNIGFKNLMRAEAAAHGYVVPGKCVEIIDEETGEVVVDLSVIGTAVLPAPQ